MVVGYRKVENNQVQGAHFVTNFDIFLWVDQQSLTQMWNLGGILLEEVNKTATFYKLETFEKLWSVSGHWSLLDSCPKFMRTSPKDFYTSEI